MPNKPIQKLQKKPKISGGTVVGIGGAPTAASRFTQTIGPVIRAHFAQVAPAGLVPSMDAARKELIVGGLLRPSGKKKIALKPVKKR